MILNSKKKKSFKVQKNKAGNYFFNVIAGNNKVIVTSQAYKSESSFKKGIESVQKNAIKKELVLIISPKVKDYCGTLIKTMRISRGNPTLPIIN